MLVAAPSGCCTGGMFSSGIHALGPFGAGEVTARVAPSTVALFRIVVDVHALQADGSAGSTDGIDPKSWEIGIHRCGNPHNL